MEWERDFLYYLLSLQEKKPVICCGDLNVAHQEIDLRTQKPTAKTLDLRMKREPALQKCWTVDLLIPSGIFIPNQEGIYSWWSYRFKAREKNAG